MSFTSSSFTSATVTTAASAPSDFFSTDANAFPSNVVPNRALLELEPTIHPHPVPPSILGLQDAFDPVRGALNVVCQLLPSMYQTRSRVLRYVYFT